MKAMRRASTRSVFIPLLQTQQMERSNEAAVVGISPKRVAYDDVEYVPATKCAECGATMPDRGAETQWCSSGCMHASEARGEERR